MTRDKVYIPEENVVGVLVSLGAFASRVQYDKGGLRYDTWLPNEEFDLLETIIIRDEEDEV